MEYGNESADGNIMASETMNKVRDVGASMMTVCCVYSCMYMYIYVFACTLSPAHVTVSMQSLADPNGLHNNKLKAQKRDGKK